MSESCSIPNAEEKTSLEKEQENRALLRERFLRCISSLTGAHCEMKTVEYNEISGLYHGMDIHVQNIFVKHLTTPFKKMNSGLIRTQDVLYLHFPHADKKLKSEDEIQDEPESDVQ